MEKLTREMVAEMTVTERLDRIGKLTPELGELINDLRKSGMAELAIFAHIKAARDMKPN